MTQREFDKRRLIPIRFLYVRKHKGIAIYKYMTLAI